MSYPTRLLNEDEDLILDLRPHWIALALPALWAVLITVGAILLATLVDTNDTMTGLIAIAWLGGMLLLVVNPVSKYFTTEFVLTTRRVISRWGVFAKNSKDIPLGRINDITFSQTILERVVGSGTLRIQSASEDGDNMFRSIRNPETVHNEVYRAMGALEDSRQQSAVAYNAPPTQPQSGAQQPASLVSTPPPPDIPAQIEKLAALRDQGAITPQEYERKKSELLDRM